MEKIKNIALVAHDNMKRDLIEWVEWNFHVLTNHNLICTGTTGTMVEAAINDKLTRDGRGAEASTGMIKLKSGPLGGDQQIGAMIAEGKIDILIFFWDPMEPQPHDVDIKAPAEDRRSIQHFYGVQQGERGFHHLVPPVE